MALDFIAGCLGGCAGVAIGHPFDTVKVKLQTQGFKYPVYRGAWDCFTKVLHTESLAGVYRGVWSPLCGVALVNAIVFGVYGNLQRNLIEPDSYQSHFLAGATAGLAQSFVSSPVELFKTRMQTRSSFQGTMDCIMSTFRGEGIRGVFKGFSITGARESIGYGLYFTTYEVLMKTSLTEAPVGAPMMLLAGGISGTVSCILTYPLDVIKTRFQADIGTYSGLVDCLKKSVQTEGLSCLGRGLMPTIVRAFPTNAVTFTVVAWVMRCADFSVDGSVSITNILDSTVGTLPKEKHVITSSELVDKSVGNFKFNRLLEMNTHRYCLPSEDLWVYDADNEFFDESLYSNLVNINRDNNEKENKLEAGLLAAELKMFDELAQEIKDIDGHVYTKAVQTKEEYKTENR